MSDDSVGSDEVELDVRPMLARGEEPFETIMATVAELGDRSLLLISPFEPTPLLGVLSSQGFGYEVDKVSDTEWRTRFTPLG